MDKFSTIIDDLDVIQRVLVDVDDVNDDVNDAWQRVRAQVLVGAMGHNPLPGRQGAGGACADFAQYLDRMGSLPRRDSEGMELLFFRWVKAAEEMTRLLERVVEGDGAPELVNARLVTAVAPMASITMDEAWQVSYCDDCGAELLPSVVCGCDELPF